MLSCVDNYLIMLNDLRAIVSVRTAEDMTTPSVKEGLQAAGVNSILPKEHGSKFYPLPLVKQSEKDVRKL